MVYPPELRHEVQSLAMIPARDQIMDGQSIIRWLYEGGPAVEKQQSHFDAALSSESQRRS